MAQNTKQGQTTRRDLFGIGASLAVAGGAFALSSPISAAGDKKAGYFQDGTLQTPADARVMTEAGRVRGYTRNGIYTFKGIPYGDSTVGARRFLPAKAPKPWEGEFLAVNYGPSCPQRVRDHAMTKVDFWTNSNDWYEREDCLRVNVWSPQLTAETKLPVMVWFHGGGFTSGSANELAAYDGENLAKRGVVVVSVNHRLGPLGFLDYADAGGRDFKHSANIGITDLVHALKWVRNNVTAFGGDPDNVTIFGHSGGGGKVSSVLSMPSAKGLFHKAIVMGGSFPPAQRTVKGDVVAKAVFDEFNLSYGDMEALQSIDGRTYVDTVYNAVNKLNLKMFGPAKGLFSPQIGFGPSLDGDVLPEAWETKAPVTAAGIPLMVGNSRDEFKFPDTVYTEATLQNAVPEPYRAKAGAIIASVREEFPGLEPTHVGATIEAIFMRKLSLEQCAKHHALGGAKTYNYWFTWGSPLFEGTSGSPHHAELFAVFDNASICEQFTGNTASAHKVADEMSSSIVAFASTGVPDVKGQSWTPYNQDTVPTMIFDYTTRLSNDPIGEAIRLAI